MLLRGSSTTVPIAHRRKSKRCLVPKGNLSHCSTGKNNYAGFYPRCELCCLRVSSPLAARRVNSSPIRAHSLSSIWSHSAGIASHECRHHGKIFKSKRKCIQSEIERHVFLLERFDVLEDAWDDMKHAGILRHVWAR